MLPCISETQYEWVQCMRYSQVGESQHRHFKSPLRLQRVRKQLEEWKMPGYFCPVVPVMQEENDNEGSSFFRNVNSYLRFQTQSLIARPQPASRLFIFFPESDNNHRWETAPDSEARRTVTRRIWNKRKSARRNHASETLRRHTWWWYYSQRSATKQQRMYSLGNNGKWEKEKGEKGGRQVEEMSFRTIFWKASVAIFARQTRSNIWTTMNVPASEDRQSLYSPPPCCCCCCCRRWGEGSGSQWVRPKNITAAGNWF